MPITAASTSSTSTTVCASASSVFSSESSCANEREISYSAPSARAASRSDASAASRWLLELGRLLVQLRILHRDRELPGKRNEERRLVLASDGGRAPGTPPAGRSPRSRTSERHRERRLDPGLARRVPHGRSSGDRARRRPSRRRAPPRERELEQPLGDARVRPGEPARRSRRRGGPRLRAGRPRRARPRAARPRARRPSRACARARARRSPGRRPQAARACARARARATRARSLARSAWAARTPNVVSRPSSRGVGRVFRARRAAGAFRRPAGRAAATSRRRSRRAGARTRRRAAVPARRGPAARARAPGRAPRPLRARTSRRARGRPARAPRASPTGAPTMFAATAHDLGGGVRLRRARRRALRRPARARDGERRRPRRAPPPKARRTSAAWPAASSAAIRSPGVNARARRDTARASRRSCRPHGNDEHRLGAGAGCRVANASGASASVVDGRRAADRRRARASVELGGEGRGPGDGHGLELLARAGTRTSARSAPDTTPRRLDELVERARERRAARGRCHCPRQGPERRPPATADGLRIRLDDHLTEVSRQGGALTLARPMAAPAAQTRKRPRSTRRRSSSATATTGLGGRRGCGPEEETRLARYRFYIVMAVLLAIAVGFVVVSWHEIQRLFGI